MKTNIPNKRNGALLAAFQLAAFAMIGAGIEWGLWGLAVVGALIWVDLNVKGRAK